MMSMVEKKVWSHKGYDASADPGIGSLLFVFV